MSEILLALEHRAQVHQAAYESACDNDEELDVKGLLKQLLTYPRSAEGIVPDSWGTKQAS